MQPYRPCKKKDVSVLSRFSCVRLCATLWTVASQAPLSMGIFQARILEWVAMPSSRGSSPIQGLNLSLLSPALAGGFFTASATWEVRGKKKKKKQSTTFLKSFLGFPSLFCHRDLPSASDLRALPLNSLKTSHTAFRDFQKYLRSRVFAFVSSACITVSPL